MKNKVVGIINKAFKGSKKIFSEGRLHLDVLIERDGDCFIAHCLDLDIVGQGKTIEEAAKNLIELIHGQIEFAISNDLEQLLVHPAPLEYWEKYWKSKSEKLRKNLATHPPSSKDEIKEKLDVAYA